MKEHHKNGFKEHISVCGLHLSRLGYGTQVGCSGDVMNFAFQTAEELLSS
jgi:hypothetical protein